MVGCADGQGWAKRTQAREAGLGEQALPSPPSSPAPSQATLVQLMRSRLRSGMG